MSEPLLDPNNTVSPDQQEAGGATDNWSIPNRIKSVYLRQKSPVKPVISMRKSPFNSNSFNNIRTISRNPGTICVSVDTPSKSSRNSQQKEWEMRKRSAKALIIQGMNPTPVSVSLGAKDFHSLTSPTNVNRPKGFLHKQPILRNKESAPPPPGKVAERVKIFESMVLSSRPLKQGQKYLIAPASLNERPVELELPETRNEIQPKQYLAGLQFGGKVLGKGGMRLGRWDKIRQDASHFLDEDQPSLNVAAHPRSNFFYQEAQSYESTADSPNRKRMKRPENRHQTRGVPVPGCSEFFQPQQDQSGQEYIRAPRRPPNDLSSDQQYLKMLLERRDTASKRFGDELHKSTVTMRQPILETDAENVQRDTTLYTGANDQKNLFKISTASGKEHRYKAHRLSSTCAGGEVALRGNRTILLSGTLEDSSQPNQPDDKLAWRESERVTEKSTPLPVWRDETKYSGNVTGIPELDGTAPSLLDYSKGKIAGWKVPNLFEEGPSIITRIAAKHKGRHPPRAKELPSKILATSQKPLLEGPDVSIGSWKGDEEFPATSFSLSSSRDVC